MTGKPNIFSSNPPGLEKILAAKHVFVAGAGGLGSNAAMLLTRAGTGALTIVDFDKVEPSNLNRQFYFLDQLGRPKVDALRENLLRISPSIRITALQEKISESNCGKIMSGNYDLILECFDKAECKAMIASHVLANMPDIPLITVSGLAGAGPSENLVVSRGPGRMYVIGDRVSEMNPATGTVSSRVMVAAAMQAHLGIRILCGLE